MNKIAPPIKEDHLTIEFLQDRIDAIYNDLTPVQQRVTLYIRKKWEQICMMTAREVAQKADVSEAAVQRIAVILGFKSFRDMKMKMRSSLLKNRAVVNFKLKDGQKTENKTSWLDEHVSMEVTGILQTFRQNSLETLQQAARLLISSERIWVLGDKMGSGTSAYLEFSLNYLIGKTVRLDLSNCDEYLSFFSESDTLVVIGFQRYSTKTLKAAELAREKGARILAFTDCDLSPFSKFADVSLYAVTDSVIFLDSYSSVLSLSHALISMIVNLDPQNIRSQIEDIERIYGVLNSKS